MESSQPTHNKSQFASFRNAFRGVAVSIKESGHLKFHLFAATGVVVAGFLFGISTFEWLILILIIGAVITAEMANTAIEDIENVIRDYASVPYEFTGKSKDIGAGVVLVFAIAATVIALIIFLPRFIPILIDMFSRIN